MNVLVCPVFVSCNHLTYGETIVRWLDLTARVELCADINSSLDTQRYESLESNPHIPTPLYIRTVLYIYSPAYVIVALGLKFYVIPLVSLRFVSVEKNYYILKLARNGMWRVWGEERCIQGCSGET